MTLIGVLALQGDFREHIHTLTTIGVESRKVRNPEDLIGLSGLIIPGGESTVIDKLSRNYKLTGPIKELIVVGLPVFGTCAGLIMLADRIKDGVKDQETFGGLEIEVQRNAFGSQVDSFESSLDFVGIDKPVKAAFIRAPIVTQTSALVEILSTLDDGRIVAVRQGNLLGISFHPELLEETSVHKYFVQMCETANYLPN